ncbi:CBS domain-containing protein [Arthrobacter sp. H14]|uniref:CBS domain-containing protein n=1 Tax=Arthrobacter sp. H14 TaxID=1312959 RepID=UPI0009DD0B93|nr:CBS domain-containing protein [Arthrobacter sp. H14]
MASNPAIPMALQHVLAAGDMLFMRYFVSRAKTDSGVNAAADSGDPKTAKAGELGEGKPVTIGADDSVEEAIDTMQQHKIRRLPVVDGHDLVGMLSQADIARNFPEERSGELVEFISF